MEQAWIWTNLRREANVREIVLLPGADGEGFPSQISVWVSNDGRHWATVGLGVGVSLIAGGEPLRILPTHARLFKWVREVLRRATIRRDVVHS